MFRMPLLGYKDAARTLGLPIGTLYALVSQHRIPHVRLGERLVRFDHTELMAWIDEHRVLAQSKLDRAVTAVSSAVRSSPKRPMSGRTT